MNQLDTRKRKIAEAKHRVKWVERLLAPDCRKCAYCKVTDLGSPLNFQNLVGGYKERLREGESGASIRARINDTLYQHFECKRFGFDLGTGLSPTKDEATSCSSYAPKFTLKTLVAEGKITPEEFKKYDEGSTSPKRRKKKVLK